MSESKLEIEGIKRAILKTGISAGQVQKTLVLLIDEDCTIPFIARYRKEHTNGLDEVQIAKILETYNEALDMAKRKDYVLKTLKEMKVLTKELEAKILAADDLNTIEDIYEPFKSKKKTKGQLAIDAGLDKLLLLFKSSDKEVSEEEISKFINKEKDFETNEKVKDGVKAILVEEVSHNLELKKQLRGFYWKTAKISSSKRKDAEKIKDYDKFKDYFEFSQPIETLKEAKFGHRFLAIRRGTLLKVLKLEVLIDEDEIISTGNSYYPELQNKAESNFLNTCIRLAVKRIHTSLSLEIKTELKKLSDESAISIFGKNLKDLLLQPYLGPKMVMGIDPGIRTGCKVAIIDNTGKFLADTIIYPFPPQNKKSEATTIIKTAIDQLKIKYIAIGNGTFGRETLDFLKSNIEQIKNKSVKALLVNEDGASIYSASEIARKEFPDKDPTVRGAISIARRFQDPLGELVKIDPKSIGVGQYQHDVNQVRLKKSLEQVVENCVNYVGVDLNTASAPLLSFISGIGPTVAEKIVEFREKNGGFKSRSELNKVSRFSDKVFSMSAGFLRIYNGVNPLDSTFIHPETYEEIEIWCKKNNIEVSKLVKDKELIKKFETDKNSKEKLGEFTHADIVKSLKAPRQDPRSEFIPFEYRDDIKTIEDLKVDQYYPGVVTNITQFGAFVDIGIKENGLIHVSQIADKFVEDPLSELKVGQEVKARLIEVDPGRKRIALSLKSQDKNDGYSSNSSSNTKSKKPFPKKELKNNAFAGLGDFFKK